jgi:hypothetical protein
MGLDGKVHIITIIKGMNFVFDNLMVGEGWIGTLILLIKDNR